jgi:hypothetical protein
MDSASHREHLLAPYKMYQTAEDPRFQGLSYEEEDYQMATGVLFGTGWGMAQVVATHPQKPTALILTSASSRTSRAAAFAAKHHNLGLEIIGLTSPGNLEYTRSLGLYDSVILYSEVSSLRVQKVGVQDVAGSAKVRQDIYRHFGDSVVYCGKVGLAHVGSVGEQGSLQGLGGAQPESFLVFTAIEDVSKVYGKAEAAAMLAEATTAFNARMLPEFKAVRAYGADATKRVYDEMVEGLADPMVTYVCSMWPEEQHEPIPAATPRQASRL